MSGEFVPGLELARDFYAELVRPAVAEVPHSAALLGPGSDALGFDTARSTDHGWDPRLQLFVGRGDVHGLDELLERRLPERYRGWPIRFGWDEQPVVERVEVTTLETWLEGRLARRRGRRPAPGADAARLAGDTAAEAARGGRRRGVPRRPGRAPTRVLAYPRRARLAAAIYDGD